MELVSILIPVYNVEKYLCKCLDSIVKQTYNNIQVIIIDDGSTDNSYEICQKYASEYSFIELYHQKNKGVATARNALLNKVKGDYVIFVDSDDWIEHSMINDLVHYIKAYNLDIIICGNTIERNNVSTPVNCKSQSPHIDTRTECIKKFLLHDEINGSLCNKLVKSSLLHDLTIDTTISYGEDALLMWQILQRVNLVGTIKTPYYHYRMNEASISHQKFDRKKISGHKVWEIICNDTHNLWPKYIDIAEATYAIMDMWLLYYAAMSNYRLDSNIRQYQRHIRRRMFNIIRAKHIKTNKKIFALGMAISYRLGGYLIRKHK